MATNLLAGNGLVFSRNRRIGANTYQGNQYTIKKGYATAIGVGDVVSTGTGGNQGYITLSADNATAVKGVFVAVAAPPGYYDNTAQATLYGLNGSWPSNANPASDVPVFVVDDPDAVFRVQVNGGPFAQSWVGNNITWNTGTNGVPNISGISTLTMNGGSIATTNTLPFRIVGVTGFVGGPQDPTNINPWIEVVLNPGVAENLQALGI